MNRWFLLQLLGLFFFSVHSHPLQADLYSVRVDGSQFVFVNPPQWKIADVEAPFDYKIIHENGNCESYLLFSFFDEKIDKSILFEKLSESIQALFGDRFWESPNYSEGFFYDESDTFNLLHFGWNKGNTIQSVMVTADSTFGDGSCSRCVVFIHKRDIANFDLHKCFVEDSDEIKKIVENTFYLKYSANGG